MRCVMMLLLDAKCHLSRCQRERACVMMPSLVGLTSCSSVSAKSFLRMRATFAFPQITAERIITMRANSAQKCTRKAQKESCSQSHGNSCPYHAAIHTRAFPGEIVQSNKTRPLFECLPPQPTTYFRAPPISSGCTTKPFLHHFRNEEMMRWFRAVILRNSKLLTSRGK